MDMDNKKDFSDRLTWLFGHAREVRLKTIIGCLMMSTSTIRKNFSDQHPYVVIETPERKYYYEAMGLVIVPEDNSFLPRLYR